MNKRLPELLNRKTKGWMNITYHEFERDIKILQQTIKEQQDKINKYESYLMENSVEEYEKKMQPYYDAMEKMMEGRGR